jgi:hypothetical protein
MSASPSPDGCRSLISLIALLQQYQAQLGSYALLSQAPAVMEVLGDQFSAETSLEDIIQCLVARDLARQVEARRARRA